MILVSDTDLVSEALSGNRDAFGQIVSRYQNLICSVAYSATGSLATSEDLAQETFITAWKQLAGLREPEKLRAWLCGIARNLINNSLRKQSREPSHRAESLEDIVESHSPEPLPVEQTISNEEAAILWRSLEKIPEIYRESLVLFYREHQSIETVAQNLDLSEDAVKQRLSRGRKLLHEQVLAFVEGALGKTSPGKTFTLGVLAALPMTATSAKAATVGSAVAMGGVSAKTAAALGTAPGWFGMVFFYSAIKAQIEDTKSPRERQFMVRRLWLSVAAMVVMAALLVGIRALDKTSYPFVHDPFVQEVALAVGLFGMTVYSVVTFEMTNRGRRRIQIEDGTFDESEWMTQKKPRNLLANAFSDNAKAHFYRMLAIGSVLAILGVCPMAAAWHGHWVSAGLWMAVFGVGCFRHIRYQQRCPRFEARFLILARGVGQCGLVALLCYNIHHFYAGSGLWNETEIVFNTIIVLVYAAFIGVLAWMHRRDSSWKP